MNNTENNGNDSPMELNPLPKGVNIEKGLGGNSGEIIAQDDCCECPTPLEQKSTRCLMKEIRERTVALRKRFSGQSGNELCMQLFQSLAHIDGNILMVENEADNGFIDLLDFEPLTEKQKAQISKEANKEAVNQRVSRTKK